MMQITMICPVEITSEIHTWQECGCFGQQLTTGSYKLSEFEQADYCMLVKSDQWSKL